MYLYGKIGKILVSSYCNWCKYNDTDDQNLKVGEGWIGHLLILLEWEI